MVTRLQLINEGLSERVVVATDGGRRQAAVAAAALAVDYSGLADARVDRALAVLRSGRYGNVAEQLKLAQLVDELDTAALDAQNRMEEGTGSHAEYRTKALQSYAATALLAAFQVDSVEAASDALYEAISTVDNNDELVAEAVAEYI